jgi:hypothetical protein
LAAAQEIFHPGWEPLYLADLIKFGKKQNVLGDIHIFDNIWLTEYLFNTPRVSMICTHHW